MAALAPFRFLGISLALFCAFSPLALASQPPQACNNSPELCDRHYNNVTHLGCHDSTFVRNDANHYSIAGTQFYDSIDQLDGGVRLLSTQIHKATNKNNNQAEWRLCHGSCDFYDAGLLSDWLASLNSWLDRNPNDVITILLVNSDNADAPTLAPIFENSKLDKRAYHLATTDKATNTWPTLGTMIQQDKRIVIFIASLDPSSNHVAPYLLDEFTFIFENPYENLKPSDFTCTPDRPGDVKGNIDRALSTQRLPLMNHFLYHKAYFDLVEAPSPEDAPTTNGPMVGAGALGAAALDCSNKYHFQTPFILVDFFNVGPAIATVDRLNGVTNKVQGRKSFPDEVFGPTNPTKRGTGPGAKPASPSNPPLPAVSPTATKDPKELVGSAAQAAVAEVSSRVVDAIDDGSGGIGVLDDILPLKP